MINIKVNNIKKVVESLNKLNKHSQFTMAVAINRTLWDMQQEEKKEISKVFKNPTAFTKKKSVVYNKAKYPEKMTGELKLLDFLGKGMPPDDYLPPQILGGERKVKRSEFWLRDKGYLPSNKFIAPAPGLTLNQFGNVTQGKMTQILSGLSAFNSAGFDANITAASKKRNPTRATFFVPKQPSALPSGIWQRNKSGNIKPLFWFVSKPNYKKRFDFVKVGMLTHKKVFEKHYNKAFSEGFK